MTERRVTIRRWPDEPACWSWSVPPVGDAGPARFLALHHHRCAVCGRAPIVLIIDHDHLTGLVRGLLCRRCNSGEGKPTAGNRLLFDAYRGRNPALIVGHWENYGSRSPVLISVTNRLRALAPYAQLGVPLERALDHLMRAAAHSTEGVQRYTRQSGETWSAAVVALATGQIADRMIRDVVLNANGAYGEMGLATGGPLPRLAHRLYLEHRRIRKAHDLEGIS